MSYILLYGFQYKIWDWKGLEKKGRDCNCLSTNIAIEQRTSWEKAVKMFQFDKFGG